MSSFLQTIHRCWKSESLPVSWKKIHFSLTFRQRGRVPWQKQWIAKAKVKEIDPTWSQNWFFPITVLLMGTSAIWGHYLVLSHPESPRVHWEGCCRSWLLDGGQIQPPTWVPSGLTVRMAVMWWLDRGNIQLRQQCSSRLTEGHKQYQCINGKNCHRKKYQ